MLTQPKAALEGVFSDATSERWTMSHSWHRKHVLSRRSSDGEPVLCACMLNLCAMHTRQARHRWTRWQLCLSRIRRWSTSRAPSSDPNQPQPFRWYAAKERLPDAFSTLWRRLVKETPGSLFLFRQMQWPIMPPIG